MSNMQQNIKKNSNRLSPLGGRDDGVFAEDMNSFYSRFDTHDFRSVIDDIRRSTKTHGELVIEKEDVLRVFWCAHVNKNPSPDGISGRVLKNYATQLSGITSSFRSLSAYRKSLPCGKRQLTFLSQKNLAMSAQMIFAQ